MLSRLIIGTFSFLALLSASIGHEKRSFPDVPWSDFLNTLEFKQLGGKATYEIKNGMVTGKAVSKTPNSFLATVREFGDFVLEYEFKVHPQLNSGVQIRSESKESYRNGRVHGYQVEIDPSARAWTGGIYDEARRGWLANLEGNEPARQAFRQNDWNAIRVEAIGANIRTWINGIPAADLTDAMTLKGFIALQVHGIGKKDPTGLQIQWRKLRYKDLGSHQWSPLFNGKDLTGWKKLPGGEWTVENGIIAGKSPKSESRHGILLSEKRFQDFAVRAQFKVVKGDSGFYFRSDPVEKAYNVEGFQVEVDSSQETGGLYETGGRGWVVNPTKAAPSKSKKKGKKSAPLYTPGQWTQLHLYADGGNVSVFLNNRLRASVENDSGRRDGHFGLQLHGNQEMDVYFKEIEILTKAGASP